MTSIESIGSTSSKTKASEVDVVGEPAMSTRKSKRIKKSKREKDKELKREMKKVEKDCKKLQKTLGKWMLETQTDLKNQKRRRKRKKSSSPEENRSSSFPPTPLFCSDLSFSSRTQASPTSVEKPSYRWDDPHIHKFFRPSLNSSLDIETDRLDIKLICPLGKMRIKHPVRSLTCDHIQPFDRDNFVKLEKVAAGRNKKSFCPICNREISSQQLVEDSFFVEVLLRSGDADEVVVYADGRWQPMSKAEREKATVEVLDETRVDDDSDLLVTDIVKPKKNSFCIDLTEDDDDDDIIGL